MEDELHLPCGALVPGKMRGNKGRWVQAGNASSLITRAGQCGYRALGAGGSPHAHPCPVVCEQMKSQPPELRMGLPQEWGLIPANYRAEWLGILGTGLHHCPGGRRLSAQLGPGEGGLGRKHHVIKALLQTGWGAPGEKGHVIRVCCAILVPENRACHSGVNKLCGNRLLQYW